MFSKFMSSRSSIALNDGASTVECGSPLHATTTRTTNANSLRAITCIKTHKGGSVMTLHKTPARALLTLRNNFYVIPIVCEKHITSSTI